VKRKEDTGSGRKKEATRGQILGRRGGENEETTCGTSRTVHDTKERNRISRGERLILVKKLKPIAQGKNREADHHLLSEVAATEKTGRKSTELGDPVGTQRRGGKAKISENKPKRKSPIFLIPSSRCPVL